MGSLLVERLYPKKVVSWATTKRNIFMNDITVEAIIWLKIICILVSPGIHMTIILDLQSRMVAYILYEIPLDIGQLMVSYMKFFKNHGSMHLSFYSLITELCRRSRVEEYLGDS